MTVWGSSWAIAVLVWLANAVSGAAAVAEVRTCDLGKAMIVADTNQPAYVQHAVQELAGYLKEITGDAVAVRAVPSKGEQPVVMVGGPAVHPLLPEAVLSTLGEEGYVIKSSRVEGRDCLAVSGASPKGTKFGVYALMKRIRPKGTAALVDLPLEVSGKPAIPLRGMHLNGWPFKYPYSFRPWPEEDWHRYIDLLSCQGVNLLYIWPFMEIIPVPVSPQDRAYLEEFRRVVDYAQREHGMEVWMMQSANRIAKDNCGVADPRHRPYWRMEHQVDMNPGDPAQLQRILDSRRALYQIVNNVNGVCTIDCDPGGWPGAPLGDWVKIFNGCRSLLNEYNVHHTQTTQIAWLHLGWGRTTPVRLDYPMGDIIKGLERDCRGPLMYIAGWPALIRMCKDAGVIDRTVALPYSTIEGEPSYPTTRITLEDVTNTVNLIHGFPGIAGAMGNAQCPLIQFPRTHCFLSGLWDKGYTGRAEVEELRDVSELLYPENAMLVADCFAALRSTKPSKINELADHLQLLIREERVGHAGVYGRKLFPNSTFVAESLIMQLRLRAAQQRLFQEIGGTPTEYRFRQLLVSAFDAYLTWDSAHGWHELWGTGWPPQESPIFGDRRVPQLVKTLRALPGSNKAIEDLLSSIAETLSATHARSNVLAYCTEPLRRLASKPAPIRSLAQQATATASVVPKPDVYPPRQAIDGDIDTLYWPGALIKNNEEWLQLTWQAPQKISRATVYFLQNASMPGRTIHLERESSSGVWTDFATAVIPHDSLAPYAVAKFELSSPVTVDKLRIVNLLDLFEVELH